MESIKGTQISDVMPFLQQQGPTMIMGQQAPVQQTYEYNYQQQNNKENARFRVNMSSSSAA